MASNDMPSVEDFLNAPDTPAATQGFLPIQPPGVTNAPITAPESIPQTNAVPIALRPAAGTPQAAFQQFVQGRERAYREQAEEPGVPLDIESGVSPWERFMLSFRREKESQVKYLQNKYGENNVRLDPNGELIVRALDPSTQKARDILVDPQKMSAKDLIDIAGAIPEIAASMVAIRTGRGVAPGLKGLGALGRDVLAGALGGESAGLLKDVGVQSYDYGGPPPNIPKIAKERAAMGLGDIAMGTATMAVPRLFNFARAPLAGAAKSVQFDNLAAKEYVKSKYGIDIPQTIGEMTGSPLFTRSETFFEKLPGGSEPFRALRAEQEDALRKLQLIMMGKQPPTDEAAGRAMIDALMAKIAPVQTAVTGAERELAQAGTKGIEKIVSDVTMPESQVLREETGKAIREGVIARRDAAKAEADKLYGIVRSLPGGTGKVFEGEGLQDSFKSILKNLPSVEETTEVPTGILGPRGEPLMATTTGKKLLKEFVPPNIVSRLREITSLESPKFSLSDLQQMRREVYDDIEKGSGVPGLGTHYLNDIGKALTRAIDDGINGLPTGDLKTALQNANSFYKEKVIPFNRIGLTELFRNPDEAGGLSNTEVLTRVFGGGKATQNYNLMKEVLGPASPEFTRLKRAVADNILDRSRYPGEELIDPQSFLSNIYNFKREFGEMADDIFGKKLTDLFTQAKVAGIGNIADKVNARDFAKLITDPSPTATKLRALIQAEKERDTLYKNEILRLVAKGELPDKGINPVDFVNRFVELGTPTQIKQAMDLLADKPDLVNDIKAKVVEKVFRDAARPATPGDIGKLLSGDPTRIVSATSVFKQIEDPNVRDKIVNIIGKDTYEDLRNYLKIHAAGEVKETSYKAAGGLAAGQQITAMERHLGRFVKSTGINYIVSNLLTNPAMRSWLGQIKTTRADPGFWATLFSSPVFLRQVAKDFPGEKGSLFVNSVKHAMDQWVKQTGGQPQEQPETGPNIQRSLSEYLNAP